MAEYKDLNESKYRILEDPSKEFIDVPAYLVEGLSPKDAFVVKTCHLLAQQNTWMMRQTIDASRVHVEQDIRQNHLKDKLDKLQTWRNNITTRGAKLAALGMLVIPAFLYWLIPMVGDFLANHLFKPPITK